jgi:hypothetical protein
MNDDYKAVIDALQAETSMPDSSAARIEAALAEAFERHRAAAAHVIPQRRRYSHTWMAAAAAVLLLASLAAWRLSFVTVNNVTAPLSANTPTESRPVRSHAPATGASSLPVAPHPMVSAGARPSGRVHPIARPRPPAVIRPSGFVELPGAAALPAFESGAIVRMELPVASLPSYGVDISTGGASHPVEADVLVGQDGRARAIRLVTNNMRSVQ